MPEPIPELLDPRRAVALGCRFAGRLPIGRLSRLRPLLESTEGSVEYWLSFGQDERGYGVVRGRVVGDLRLRCQRCNEELALAVDSKLLLALVEGLDEAAALPDDYDPLLLDGRLMRSSELIEDELLLAVPAIPRHPEGSCASPLPPDEHLPEGGGEATRARLAGLAEPTAGADIESVQRPDEQPAARIESERPNPFAALAALRRDRNQ